MRLGVDYRELGGINRFFSDVNFKAELKKHTNFTNLLCARALIIASWVELIALVAMLTSKPS